MITIEQTNNSNGNALPTLGDYDVLCGRHKAAFNNAGNKRFRVTVSLSLDCFMKASTRKEKNTLIKSILKIVENNGGKFVEFKKDQGLVELSTKKAHMKVGHALRDMALAARTSTGGRKGTTHRPQKVLSSETPTVVVSASSSADGIISSAIEDPLDIFYSISSDDIPETTTAQDTQTEDMLQWLVGESDGLLGERPVEEQVPMPSQPADGSYGNRSSIVIDDSMVQWLMGESNDVAFDQFEFVECI